MALSEWRFIYADRNFIPQGELLNANDRTLSIALSKLDTASFSVRTDHPMADRLVALEGFLKIYRNNVLLFYGPLIDAEESVSDQGGKITINATSPAWVLSHRWRSPDLGSYVTPAAGDTRGYAVAALIESLNVQYTATGTSGTPDWYRSQGETGIRREFIGPGYTYPYNVGATLAAAYTMPLYKPLMEILQEFATGSGGFDWRFMPWENFTGGIVQHNYICQPYFGAPLGTTRPEAIFEFGDGKLNIKSYRRVMSRATQANVVRHQLVNGAETAPPVATDATSRATWGVLEDLAQAELTDTTLRQQLVNEHVAVRKSPRHTIEFEPTPDYGNGRLPRYGTDYNVGDTVTARAVALSRERFNAQFRVWSVEFSLDANGIETPKLTLSDS